MKNTLPGIPGQLHYLHFWWNLNSFHGSGGSFHGSVSFRASMEVTSTEASVKASTETSTEASVRAYTETSTEVTSTQASVKASTKVFSTETSAEAFVEAFVEVNYFHASFRGSIVLSRKLPCK